MNTVADHTIGGMTEAARIEELRSLVTDFNAEDGDAEERTRLFRRIAELRTSLVACGAVVPSSTPGAIRSVVAR